MTYEEPTVKDILMKHVNTLNRLHEYLNKENEHLEIFRYDTIESNVYGTNHTLLKDLENEITDLESDIEALIDKHLLPNQEDE